MRFPALFVSLIVLASGPAAGQATCPTPPPPAGLDPTSLDDRARLLQYARSLSFHAARAPTGDSRPLTVVSTPGDRSQRRFRLSVDAETQPEVCAHRNRLDGLRTGRVVARVTLSAAYDKLRMPAGVSYVWIDQADSTSARGVIIPDDMTTPARTVTMRVNLHPELPPRSFAESRWLFDPTDDGFWVACVESGCCESLGDGPP